MWGGGCEVPNLGEADPEPGGGERKKGGGVMKNEWFLGCCDAGGVIDCEECIISITTAQEAM